MTSALRSEAYSAAACSAAIVKANVTTCLVVEVDQEIEGLVCRHGVRGWYAVLSKTVGDDRLERVASPLTLERRDGDKLHRRCEACSSPSNVSCTAITQVLRLPARMLGRDR